MNRYLFQYGLCSLAVTSSLLLSADMYTNTSDKTNEGEKIITPSTNPVVQHGFDLFLTADFIYWTTRIDNIDYAQTGVTRSSDVIGPNTNLDKNGTTLTPHHKMSPGFKGGIGINMGHDGWDSLVEYTWIHNSASSANTSSATTTSLWSYGNGSVFNNTSSTIGSSKSLWQLHFNNINWELGREFFISSHLILRPHIGLKGSWQKQTYSVHQDNIQDLSVTGSGTYIASTGSYNMYQKQSYWGLGTRAGLNTAWHFNRNWSIFGDCAVAALWSQFTVSRIDHTTEAATNSLSAALIAPKSNVIVLNQSNRIHSLRPVLELDLGIRWDYWFLDDDYRIRIEAAWEEQVWFGQNEFIDSTNPTYGNLSLQGLTLGFRFDF